jgi:hypothetical protein
MRRDFSTGTAIDRINRFKCHMKIPSCQVFCNYSGLCNTPSD